MRDESTILAVISADMQRFGGYGVPWFYCRPEECETIAQLVARPLRASVHGIKEGLYMIVRH
jgi:hypothetical protein